MMNRYEEILTRLVAAEIAAGVDSQVAAECPGNRRAAALLESHFQARELAQMQEREMSAPIPALLRRQAE